MEKQLTSPRTGKVYTVVPQEAWYNTFENGKAVPQYYTRYDIYDGDRKVQFALDVNKVEEMVLHYEGYTDGVTSSPRD